MPEELTIFREYRHRRTSTHFWHVVSIKVAAGVLGVFQSTLCNACQPRTRAHQGTIAAHSIWARHIPGTSIEVRLSGCDHHLRGATNHPGPLLFGPKRG